MSELDRIPTKNAMDEVNSSMELQESVSQIWKEICSRISAAGGPLSSPLSARRQIIDLAWTSTRNALSRTKTPFSCRGKGCWGCCRGQISVSRQEVEEIRSAMGEPARSRVLSLQAITPEAEKTAVCPLLDRETGACTVWDIRPLACRAYNVISPVDDCFPERVGEKETSMVALPICAVAQFMEADLLAGREWTTLTRALVEAESNGGQR